MKTILTILFLFVMTCVGCGGPGANDSAGNSDGSETNNINSTADMKSALETIAKSGEAGSAAMGFRETLESLKKTDSAKADELLSDLDKLESAKSPAATKKIAKQMAGKL
ncbi:MAG: hypothetical protein QM501_05510 [Gimesia sp.]